MASDPRANLKPLSRTVPKRKFGPRDTVDFTQVPIPQAGEMRRPDTTDTSDNLIDLAYGLARVPDDTGQTVG